MLEGFGVVEHELLTGHEKPHPLAVGRPHDLSMPHLGDSVNETGKRLVEIPGMVPSLKEPAPGCLFAPRCTNATVQCVREAPPLELHAPRHWAACWNPVAA